MRIFIVRHGESEANAAGTFEGYADAALTTLGRAQAAQIAQRAPAWRIQSARLITSPMQRARHTADAIAAALSLTPQIDARLVAGEGRVKLDLDEAGCEVAGAIDEMRPPGGDLIAVSHRFPIRAYLSVLYGADEAMAIVERLGNCDALEISGAAAPIHHRVS